MRRLVAGLLVVASVGCGRAEVYEGPAPTPAEPATVPPTLSEALIENGGCRDAYFYALNAAGTVMVTVDWPNRIHTNPPVSELTMPAPSDLKDSPRVRLVRGKRLRSLACSDVVDPSTYSMEGELLSGRLKVEIGIGRDEGPFGTMHLDDAMFSDPAGGHYKLSPLQVGPVNIGWWPG